MAIVIYGRKTSLNVQKALWALEEVGKPYERMDVGGAFGKLDTPEFLGMNPHGLIPVFKDNKQTLWESNTIVRYIVANHSRASFGGRRQISAVSAEAEQWMDWSSIVVMPALTDVFVKTVRTAPKLQNREAIEAAAEKLNSEMTKLDAWLANRDFMLGPKISAADIAVGSNLYRYYAMDFERPNLKNLRSYFDRLLDRPAYARTIVTSFEPLRIRDEDVPDPVDGESVQEKAMVTADQAKEMASQALGAAKEKASAAAEVAKEKAGEAAEMAKEQAGKAIASARSWFENRKKKS